MRHRPTGGRVALLAAAAAIALAASGCATPIGVKHVDARRVHRTITSNVLSTGTLSNTTQIVLSRLDLDEQYRADPDAALERLHAAAVQTDGSDVYFAAAEASFLRAERTRRRSRYRAAAVYAYAYLFPADEADSPSPYDPSYRLACNLYNRGITAGFASEDGDTVVLQSGLYELPFGWLDVSFDREQLRWWTRELGPFTPVAELEIRGLRNHYRRAGVGAPLAASAARRVPGAPEWDFVAPRVTVPVNAFLRIERPRDQLASSETVRATFELRAGNSASEVDIGARTVPLELETSSSLAYMLAHSRIWESEWRGFLFGDLTRDETRLVALYPYAPDRIPVVLVHGTASSAGRWAEMLNDLVNDPRIAERYQFWFFTYDTGNPVAYSAMLLRQALEDTIERLDPRGADPALSQLVLIGHSQGGLLVKMTAVDSGDALWNRVSRVPISALKVKPETRQLLEEALFVEPLPFVRRVIFIATPQRGSFVAGSRIAHWISRFVKLPARLGRAGLDLLSAAPQTTALVAFDRVPSSVDNMTPGNRFMMGLSSIPVSPQVAAHSIIAVRGDGPVEEGDDGVVEYASAHIDEAASELVVRSGHSVQGHPDAIEEVRRILLLHAGIDRPGGSGAGSR